jgi:hypothetical protein
MADPKDTITEEMIKGIKESLDKSIMSNASDLYTQTVWVPEEEKRRSVQRKWQRELYQDWDRVSSAAADPVHRLRNEMHDELRDIKKAINKIGIMLDSDAPSQEQLEEHTTLREAYRKYKMIEALTLGKKE